MKLSVHKDWSQNVKFRHTSCQLCDNRANKNSRKGLELTSNRSSIYAILLSLFGLKFLPEDIYGTCSPHHAWIGALLGVSCDSRQGPFLGDSAVLKSRRTTVKKGEKATATLFYLFSTATALYFKKRQWRWHREGQKAQTFSPLKFL